MTDTKRSATRATQYKKAKQRRFSLQIPRSLRQRTILVIFVAVFCVTGGYILFTGTHAATPSGLSVIKSGYSGKCLSDWLSNNHPGAKVAISTCNGSSAQSWVRHNDYTIQDNGQCLGSAVTSLSGVKMGSNVVMEPCDGRPTERWFTYDTHTKRHDWLQMAGTDLCIDSPQFKTTDGTWQQLWNCHVPITQNQIWTITKITSPGGGCLSNTAADPAQAKCQAKILMTQAPWKWNPTTQFSCLDNLWNRESSWNRQVMNASSGAFGIAQALGHGGSHSAAYDPVVIINGGKASRTVDEYPTTQANAESSIAQIKWGLDYIKSTYGSPCTAWQHEVQFGWYVPRAVTPAT